MDSERELKAVGAHMALVAVFVRDTLLPDGDAGFRGAEADVALATILQRRTFALGAHSIEVGGFFTAGTTQLHGHGFLLLGKRLDHLHLIHRLIFMAVAFRRSKA